MLESLLLGWFETISASLTEILLVACDHIWLGRRRIGRGDMENCNEDKFSPQES